MSDDLELDARADALAARLPAELKWHARVAYDLSWSWQPGGDALFSAIDARRWAEHDRNPVRLLSTAPIEVLRRAARDASLVARAKDMSLRLESMRARSSVAGPSVAFFCAEFAVHGSLPIYGGGLGVLAGDVLKEASDDCRPLVGVGLLYRRGYFRQRLDHTGKQVEYWTELDRELLPLVPVNDANGAPLHVELPIRGHAVHARVWRVQVGKVPLYLLDADVAQNAPIDRWITSQLYVADRAFRLTQYALLGIGGVRALRAMQLAPDVFHLNEGHPAFAAVELAREETGRGASLDDAFARVRSKLVFTTHTPVAAGNEHYDPREVTDALGDDGSLIPRVLQLGSDGSRFGMTELALRVSRSVNAVSAKHEEVARAMWRGVAREDAPVRHVTNGVHLPTWMSPPMRALLRDHLGEGWESRASDPATWSALDRIPDEALWKVRGTLRAALVDFVRERSVMDRLARGESAEYVEAAARSFDANTLTLGFARRVASYKRMHLLIRDAARAVSLLSGDRPIQVILAGKAHPHDAPAKEIVERIFEMKRDPEVGRRVVFLEDYALHMAQVLVAGCDVWVNVPRPPQEASGTSGMKAALNGGVNLSVMDGWWCEGFDGENGFAIHSPQDVDASTQDDADARALYDHLEHDIIPAFHERDASGVPRRWVARIRRSLKTLGPRFCATRMVDDYARTIW